MIATRQAIRIGIDIGGTKISAIALDDQGSPLWHGRVATPPEGYQPVIEAVAKLVETIEAEVGSEGTVGVGTPGSLSRLNGCLKNCNSISLNGFPVKDDLGRVLKRTVRVANDADCFTLSEAVDGAGADAPIVFGVIIGTGCGGGLAIDQRLIVGPNGITGEWGHNPMAGVVANEFGPRECYCGRLDCVEAYLQGRGLSETSRQMFGVSANPKMLNARLDAGDKKAHALIDVYAKHFAAALGAVINVIDPDVIVVGGGLSNIGLLYDKVPDYLTDYVFSDSILNRVVPALYGDDSGVRGAAWLWNN